MKVIIAGGRNFDNFILLKKKCDEILADYNDITIISGTANGADKLGERYAAVKGYDLLRFPADWKKGKSAGYLRNIEMAENADILIAFWDKASRGTGHMIDIAKKRNLIVHVINY